MNPINPPSGDAHWQCTRCGHVMTTNMTACPRCSYTVFAPIRPDAVPSSPVSEPAETPRPPEIERGSYEWHKLDHDDLKHDGDPWEDCRQCRHLRDESAPPAGTPVPPEAAATGILLRCHCGSELMVSGKAHGSSLQHHTDGSHTLMGPLLLGPILGGLDG